MYQDEAGFGRISKLDKAWAPERVRPIIHSHHIREYRYCYGAVDARTSESFFPIAGACNTAWMNEFLKQLSEAYPHDDIVPVLDNAVWHKSKTLEEVIDKLQEVIQGLHWSVLKSIVHNNWVFSDFGIG